MRSTATVWSNRAWMRVPPEKSIPYRSPPAKAIDTRPAAMNARDSRYAQRRLPMKSKLGSLKSWSMGLNGESLDPAAARVEETEDQGGEEDSREETRRDADGQRDGEPLHRARPEVVEDHGGHQHRDV